MICFIIYIINYFFLYFIQFVLQIFMSFHSCRLDSIFHNIIWHEYKSLLIVFSCILFNDWILCQDDWDSDFDDESASQVGAQGNGAPPNYTATSDNSGNLALPAASYQSRGSIGDVSAIGQSNTLEETAQIWQVWKCLTWLSICKG